MAIADLRINRLLFAAAAVCVGLHGLAIIALLLPLLGWFAVVSAGLWVLVVIIAEWQGQVGCRL